MVQLTGSLNLTLHVSWYSCSQVLPRNLHGYECTIDTMKFNPCNKSYAHEVHLSESYPTRELSLYVCLLMDGKFGTCIVLCILIYIYIAGKTFKHYSVLQYNLISVPDFRVVKL